MFWAVSILHIADQKKFQLGLFYLEGRVADNLVQAYSTIVEECTLWSALS